MTASPHEGCELANSPSPHRASEYRLDGFPACLPEIELTADFPSNEHAHLLAMPRAK